MEIYRSDRKFELVIGIHNFICQSAGYLVRLSNNFIKMTKVCKRFLDLIFKIELNYKIKKPLIFMQVTTSNDFFIYSSEGIFFEIQKLLCRFCFKRSLHLKQF